MTFRPPTPTCYIEGNARQSAQTFPLSLATSGKG
jgi:hypothetical protein